MGNKVAISIVVSSWNAADIIEESLASIQDTAADLGVEVLVVDDASADGGFSEVQEKFNNDPRFTFIQNEKNIGYSRTVNLLLERAKGTYLMTLDTDARLKPGSLRALFDFMERTPEAGAALGKLLNPDGSLQYYYRRILTPTLYFFTTPLGRFVDKYILGLQYHRYYHYDGLDLAHDVEMEQPPVACLVIRREALEGDSYIFDPRFRLYMLDVDFARRVYDRGYKIFVVADAPVTHLKTATASRHGARWLNREFEKSIMLYFKKHYPLLAPLMRVVQILDQATRALLRFAVGREPMR